MRLQFDGDRADKRRRDKFIDVVVNDQSDLTTVGGFKKKTIRKRQMLEQRS